MKTMKWGVLPALALQGSYVSMAEIPRHGQASLTTPATVEIQLPDHTHTPVGRYGFQGLAYVVGDDPTDGTRRVLQATEDVGGSFAFEDGAANLIVEWEQYHSRDGGSDCIFFSLVDADGQALWLQRLADDTHFPNIPGYGNAPWSESLPLDQWVRLRLEYTARTGGEGSNDGTAVMKMWTGMELTTVANVVGHDLGDIACIGLRLTQGTTTGRIAAWRKLVWDGTGQDVYDAAGNDGSLWRDIGHQIGMMEPDGSGGIRAKIWVHYDVGLYGEGTLHDAEVEIDTDPAFPSPQSQVAAIAPLDAYNGVVTFSGLLPNTEYHVRARLKKDAAVMATTAPTSFKTVSVPGGAPGKIHFVHGSCSQTKEGFTPNTTYRTALSHAPDDAAVVFSHVGDLQYVDNMLLYNNAPPGDNNPNATHALFDRAYDQMFMSEAFHELASHATCWFMWDDHEVKNGRSGTGMGGPGQPNTQLFQMAAEAAQRWWGNRLLGGASIDRFYFHTETARCLFIYLDVRTYGDHVTTLLGQEQKDWVMDLLAANTRPLVFLISQTTWSSGASNSIRRRESWHDHTVERDQLIEHFLQSNPTAHLFLLSGDTHFNMHNTSEFVVFGPRVHGDWMSGSYAAKRHSAEGTWWEPGGIFEADHIETFGVAINEFVRGYATVDIDEADLAVRIAFVDGVTGAETYARQELSACPGDLDADGDVGVTDFLSLLSEWGPCPGCPSDLDDDGLVGTTDMLLLLALWGPCL